MNKSHSKDKIIQMTTRDEEFVKYWEMLADVCVNEDDEIESDFLHFPKGTDKFEIWHWLDEMFSDGLMAKINNCKITFS